MSFILCMLILIIGCNVSGLPLEQDGAKNPQSGVAKDAGPVVPPVEVQPPKDESKNPDVKSKAEESPQQGAPQKPPDISTKKQAPHEDKGANLPSKPATNGDDFKSHKKFNHANNVTEMDSSTLKRLVLVLVALSIMFILYLAFRTYRRGNRRGPIIVSKYGVRTRRSDLEMRPLPLDEDDEDETVFDLGNVNSH